MPRYEPIRLGAVSFVLLTIPTWLLAFPLPAWAVVLVLFASSFFGPLVKGEPRLLIKDGTVQEGEMRAAKLSQHDLEQALRLRSRQDPSRIERAYLERNGSISVIPFEKEPRVLEVAAEQGTQTIRIKLE